MPPIPPPQELPNNPSGDDLIEAFVKWIHVSPFVRQYKSSGVVQNRAGAGSGAGWDFRIQEYAYARSRVVNFQQVYDEVGPVINRLAGIIARYDWPTIAKADAIAEEDLLGLQECAEWICNTWGGVRQANFAATWEVVKSAVAGEHYNNAPMNSGWTKVASFATDGLPKSQTIWDSRVSTSIVWRIDKILHHNGMVPGAFPCLENLRVVGGRGGTRVRPLHNHWPHGTCTWPMHFAGSEIVRRIVKSLNNPHNGFPSMPQPIGINREWDVFGVGLVLFMDGY